MSDSKTKTTDEKKKGLVGEFQSFVLRGNVVDLAVGVVMGAAFGAVVTSLVENILTPILGVFGTPDFKDWVFFVGKGEVRIGLFFNAIISLLTIGMGVFVLMVKPLNRLNEKSKPQAPVHVTVRDCPYCLSAIPKAATRCAFCTAEVSVEAEPAPTGSP